MSQHHLAFVIVSAGHTVEVTRSDYGYDLSMFTFDASGAYENGNIFIQLKATDTLKIDAHGRVKFRISKKDVLNWEKEPFPVYLVVFDAANRRSYGLYLQQYMQVNTLSSVSMKGNSVQVLLSPDNIDEGTVENWRRTKNAMLAQIGAVTHV